MKKQLYYSILLVLIGFNASAQYAWQWAKYGGGNTGSSSSGFNYTEDESIRDIAVDNQNNYYYLSTMNPTTPTLNGTPVTSYHQQDLFLFSTDCQGNVRWTRTIGGRNRSEYAWNIELDNNGGIYILGGFFNSAYTNDPTPIPIHFDDTTTIPLMSVTPADQTTMDPGLKNSYLLKYNTTDGSLVWHHPLQGDVNWATRNADSAIYTMDSAKNIHAILGFRAGTHLNGLITVPSTFTNTFQYYLVKFNYDNGNMTPQANPLLLPIIGDLTVGLSEGKVNLCYDEVLNRYYLVGKREYGDMGSYADFSYGGTAFTKDGYLLAFNGSTGAEIYRKEIDAYLTTTPRYRIFGIEKDSSSNIYLTGLYYIFNPNNTLTATFGNYNFPTSNGQTPFAMKLDSNGNVLWSKTVDGYANSTVATGGHYNKGALVLNGNELAFVKGSQGDKWGTNTMTRPPNDDNDPLLVRLNKDTGAVIGAHDILSSYGSKDEFTSIAVDNDGNYVLGGFSHGILFEDANDGVPSMNGTTGSGKSQFFVAKLATSAQCTQLATEEVPVKETDMQFYPNPVEDVLNIKTKEELKGYEIISSVGQLVKKGDFARNNYNINMQGLTKGVYFVKVHTEKLSVVEKVVKK